MSHDANRQRLLGALLMAVGALIAGLCGLCSLTTLLGMFWGVISSWSSGYGVSALPGIAMGLVMVGAIGGLPTFIGVLLFRRGLKMQRGPTQRTAVGVFGDDPDGRA